MRTDRLRKIFLGFGVTAAAALGTAALAPAVQALDRLAFDIPEQPEGLRTTLTSASVLLAAQRAGTTDPQDLFAAAQAEYTSLLTALYGAGHYSSVINILIDGREAADISTLHPPTTINEIIVRVAPGPVFTFGRANVAPLAPDTALPEGFTTGARARSTLIGTAANAAVTGWRTVGHAKADLGDERISADHGTATLDADLTVLPGPRLRFGEFNFQGADNVRNGRVRAIAGFPQGEVFTPEALATVNTRLLRSGAFRSVSLREAEEANPDGTLDVNATLIEEAPRRIGFGGEIASFDGITVSGFWMHRNILGGAERLRFEGEISGIGAQLGGTDYKFATTLSRPATFDPDTSLYFGISVARINQEDFNSDTFGLNVGVNHIFSDRLTGRAAINYDYADVTDDIGSQTFQTVSVPVGLTWDKRDVPLDPKGGFYIDGELTPFTDIADSGRGIRAFADGRIYHGFSDGRFVLAARAQAGSIYGASLRETPRDMLFYSGGARTVRGQPYQSLGVFSLSDDQRSGGRSFFAGSAEVRVGVTENIGVVGFYDAGFVGEGAFFNDTGDWHSGAGIGLRYNTGIGPIRFDVAAPVSGSTGEGVQIYIGIGQAF